jgi:hypothetical protein
LGPGAGINRDTCLRLVLTQVGHAADCLDSGIQPVLILSHRHGQEPGSLGFSGFLVLKRIATRSKYYFWRIIDEFVCQVRAMLPESLLARLRKRAADPKTRSDAFEAVQETLQDMAGAAPRPTRISMGDAGGGDAFGGLKKMMAGAVLSGGGLNLQKLAEQVAEDVRTGKKSMEDIFGGAPPGAGMEIYEDERPSDTPRDLSPPASREDIAIAESALGFPLPEDLKQLYMGIANGGFGPSVGILPLAELTDRYREIRSEPQGPGDEMWPDHLLPVVPVDMGEACYDLETGNIICWDQEEFMDEDSEDEAWDRSFKLWADSLADWLEKWLGEKPMSEQVAEQHSMHRIEIANNAIEALRGMTQEERSEMGLPDEGWEEMVCRDHGADPGEVL